MPHPLLIEDPFWTPSRVVSGLIAAIYVVGAFVSDGFETALKMFGFCLLALACIWWSEAMSEYQGIGNLSGIFISRPSPPGCVFLLGWALLLFPFPLAILLAILSVF
jgi:hypothetical protein